MIIFKQIEWIVVCKLYAHAQATYFTNNVGVDGIQNIERNAWKSYRKWETKTNFPCDWLIRKYIDIYSKSEMMYWMKGWWCRKKTIKIE